jgi:integrase/recombinase XerD
LAHGRLNSGRKLRTVQFEVTLGRPEAMAKMQSVRVPHKLPVILSKEEVTRLIACVGHIKHQTALSLAYGTGLRVGEVVALKVGDIDSKRMTLRVEQGKGLKCCAQHLRPNVLPGFMLRCFRKPLATSGTRCF